MNEQSTRTVASGTPEADRNVNLSDAPELRGRKGVRVRGYLNLSAAMEAAREAARSSQAFPPALQDVKGIH